MLEEIKNLLPDKTIELVHQVFLQGAMKYRPRGYESVIGGREFYTEKAIGHIKKSKRSHREQESGLPHLAHAAANCLIALWHEQFKDESIDNEEPK